MARCNVSCIVLYIEWRKSELIETSSNPRVPCEGIDDGPQKNLGDVRMRVQVYPPAMSSLEQLIWACLHTTFWPRSARLQGFPANASTDDVPFIGANYASAAPSAPSHR